MSQDPDPVRDRLYELIVRSARLHGENTGEAGHETADLHEAVGLLLAHVAGDRLDGVRRELSRRWTDWEEALREIESGEAGEQDQVDDADGN